MCFYSGLALIGLTLVSPLGSAADELFWAHMAGLVGSHEAAVDNPAVHALQHMLFVGFGINMWMALLGPLPKPAWFGERRQALRSAPESEERQELLDLAPPPAGSRSTSGVRRVPSAPGAAAS